MNQQNPYSIVVEHGENLKAFHCALSPSHMNEMNPHLTQKGSNPSPSLTFNNMAYIA